MYSRSGVDRLSDTSNRTTNQPPLDLPTGGAPDIDGPPDSAITGAAAAAASSYAEAPQQQNIFDKLRGADIDLLRLFDVNSIVNLMVEKRKVMFGVK